MADADSAAALSTPSPFSLRFIGDDSGETFRRAEQATERAARKQEQIGERAERLGAEEQQAMAAPRAAAERALSSPRPEIPEQEKVPNPPKAEDYQKLSMGYLGAMVLLGAFGGKFIRGGGNAALSAFNGALKGWQEGNLEAYQNASAEWKEKQQQVLDNNRAKLDKYRTILEDRNASIQEQMFRMKLVSAEFQDRLMYDRTAAENYNGAAQLYEKQASIHDRAQKTTQDLIDQQTQQNETAVARANQWKAHLATPQGQQEFNQLTPAQQFQIKGFVDTYADQTPVPIFDPTAPGEGTGGVPQVEPPPGTPMDTATTPLPARLPPELRAPFPPAGTKSAERDAWYFEKGIWEKHGRPPSDQERGEHYRLQHPGRTAPAIALQERIEEYQATHDGQAPPAEEIQRYAQEYAAAVSAGRAVGGRLGNILVSAGEVEELAPQAIETSARVPRGKWVKLNQIKLNLMGQASDPDYADFVAANRGLITAYGSTMSRSGANTVSAQNHAEEAINLATSHEAYVRVVKRLQKEVDAVKRAPQHAMEALRQMGIKPEGGGGTTARPGGEPADKPQRVEQNGHIYQLGTDGNYHPVQ